MKTVNEILTAVYTLIVSTPINDLNGGIYKRTRPTDSTLQDTVIDLINGVKSKFIQDGSLSVKIFYNDIFDGNTYWEDSSTAQTIENLLFDLADDLLNLNDYSFDISSRQIYTAKFEGINESGKDINQHYAILKMNFQLTYD